MRFRILLPVLFGLLVLGLFAWNAHNQKIIESWQIADYEGPAWPYRAPTILLAAINAPAAALAFPFRLFVVRTPVLNDGLTFLAILVWWWWCGTRIDFGLLGTRSYRRPRRLAATIGAVATALLFLAVQDVANGFRWWHRLGYKLPSSEWLELLRPIGPACWWIALAGTSLVVAMRLFRRDPDESARRPVASAVFSAVAVLSLGVRLLGGTSELLWVPRSPDTYASVRGLVADEAGSPLKSVEVELFPADKTGDARWDAREFEFTDALGRYTFDRLEPGVYVVAVHYYDAPNERRPYARVFYPGVEAESAALRIHAVRNAPVNLEQLRVRRLPLATIKVEALWPDRTRPKRCHVLIHNPNYPHQATIGDVSVGIDDGRGQIVIPTGFDYSVTVRVSCEGDKVIESRESLGEQQLRPAPSHIPEKLTFTLPGPPCKLWTPNRVARYAQ